MKELELLLNKRWVLKSENKEQYYKIRDSIGEIRKFTTDKLGCQLIENSMLVKLEKLPAVPEQCMGIDAFTSKEEYAYLCILLMFLEERDAQEQFILSTLTEYISANMPGEETDWTIYTCRRRLIKVLRYATEQGILKITDGTDEAFMEEKSGEVLYENTGASRYFMRNFTRDIMGYTKPQDFMESDWFSIDEEKGIARRHRVYKNLLFSVGMYRGIHAEEDFEYLKYYGNRVKDDLEQNFDCMVHIHKGGAFFMMGEDCHMGSGFPGSNALSDIILQSCRKIREKVESGKWEPASDETIYVEKIEFENLLKELKTESGEGFTKQYREMPEGEFTKEVIKEMERWTFLRQGQEDNSLILYPSTGKLSGKYPEDYSAGSGK